MTATVCILIVIVMRCLRYAYVDIELSEVLAENIAIYSSGIHSRLFFGNEITYMTFDL